MATRCMTQAVYFNSGELSVPEYHHYGLAAPLYTHFTSPIRRCVWGCDVGVREGSSASAGFQLSGRPLHGRVLFAPSPKYPCKMQSYTRTPHTTPHMPSSRAILASLLAQVRRRGGAPGADGRAGPGPPAGVHAGPAPRGRHRGQPERAAQECAAGGAGQRGTAHPHLLQGADCGGGRARHAGDEGVGGWCLGGAGGCWPAVCPACTRASQWSHGPWGAEAGVLGL